MLDVVCPPRSDTTGAHLVNAGPGAYLFVVQGPEARWLTARMLEFIEALHEKVEENGQSGG